MWFRFPKGVERIAVERQQFSVEATDSEGRGYFRAPDHFAPSILMLQGFSLAGEVPKDAPADLPKDDPLRDNAIAQLTATQEALKIETQNLRADLGAAAAQVKALETEKAALTEKLVVAEARVAELEDEEQAEATVTPKGKPSK